MLNCRKVQCPAAKRIGGQLHYLHNSDAYKARGERWRQENLDRYRSSKRAYLDRSETQVAARARVRRWTSENTALKRQSDKAWREQNRARDRANKARYRAAMRKATPPWLTAQHKQEILAFYEEAERLTIETGILHEVDHIHPLQAGCACGLHVPWNLRVIPRVENNRRRRKWTSDELTAFLEPYDGTLDYPTLPD